MTGVKLPCEKCFIFAEKRHLNTSFSVTFTLCYVGGEHVKQYNTLWISEHSRKNQILLVWDWVQVQGEQLGQKNSLVQSGRGEGWASQLLFTMEGWEAHGEWILKKENKYFWLFFFPSNSHYYVLLSGVAEVASSIGKAGRRLWPHRYLWWSTVRGNHLLCLKLQMDLSIERL